MDEEIRSSIARNGGIMMATQLITWISTFVLLLFLPRMLGSEAFGALYLALSLAMILEVVIGFGGNLMIPKEVARNRDKAGTILMNYIGLRIAVWVIGLSLIMLFAWVAGYSSEAVLLIFIICVSKLWEGISKTIKSCFQGIERLEYPSLGIIGEKVFVSAVAVALLFMGYGVVAIACVIAAGTLLNLIISSIFIPKLTQGLPKVEWSQTSALIKSSLPYFLGSVFGVIYFRVDAVMLSLLTSEDVVGWYGAAYRFFDVVMFLPSIFTLVAFPIYSRLWVSEKQKLADTTRKSLEILCIAGVPITLLIFFNSRSIVNLFFGLEEYLASVIILQIFGVGILLIYIDFILGRTIMAVDKQKIWAFVGFLAIFVNIGLNWFLIPYTQAQFGNGGIGAAAATLATELFIMASALVLIPNHLIKGINIAVPAKLIVSGLVMGAFLKAGIDIGVHWILVSLVASVLYAALLRITGVVNARHMQILQELFHYKKIKSVFVTLKS